MHRRRVAVILALTLILSAGYLAAQTTPEQFLGFKVGADKKLADYVQISAYFQKLAGETNKMKIVTIGETTLKKPMIMAVISTPENLAKLDRWREIAKKLRDPRITSPAEAQKLAKEGKAIVLVTCSLHSTEIGASQMSMELAYDLVTGKTTFDAKKALEDVIVLLVPSGNPDGTQMVVDWYKKYLGTQFESGSMPWLYHSYAGHDNNRDWYMQNLLETRAVAKIAYHDWLPQIHLDLHQQGSNGARLFIPPYMDPPLPNIHPLVWRTVNLVGTSMAYDLQRQGMAGVNNGRSYTAWYIGACDDTPWLHNVAGILSEAASVRLASPIFIEPTELSKANYEKMMDFVDPWPGGWWRLRDIVDYELVFSKSLVKTASLNREDILSTYYQLNKAAVEKTERNQPFAFVVSAKQHDYPTMLKMLEVLQMGGVEIHQAKADFIAADKVYPAGSFVVKMAQPYKPFAWAMLEKQKYPDLRQRRLDLAGPDGRRLRHGHGRLRRQARKNRTNPLPQNARGKRPESLFRPQFRGQRLLSRGHGPSEGQRRSLADEDAPQPKGNGHPGRQLHRQELARSEKGPPRPARKIPSGRFRSRRCGRHRQSFG
jgi:hypothetical protein